MQLNALLHPLKLTAAIALASILGTLTACTGNSSSTSPGPVVVIEPIVIDKTITEVEWTADNYVTNASHAYRATTKNSMLRLVFTNQVAAFDLLINLFRVQSNRDCKISGRMITEQESEICKDSNGDIEICTNDSVLIESIQKSQAISCQDGDTSGLFFNGFFNISSKIDLTVANEERKSTTISALGSALAYDQNGDLIVDEYGDPVLNEFINYLFQSDTATFFFDNEYESYIDFSETKLICGTKEYKQVVRQGMRSEQVGSQEGDGVNNFYLYTQFSDLQLEAIPTYTCDNTTEEVSTTYAYSLSTHMASAAMGGGDNRSTQVTWADMMISLDGMPSGTLTLVHQNTDSDSVTVTVTFNDDTVMVTDGVTLVSYLLADFLALSEPLVSESAQ
jgi:hypothetical protein